MKMRRFIALFLSLLLILPLASCNGETGARDILTSLTKEEMESVSHSDFATTTTPRSDTMGENAVESESEEEAPTFFIDENGVVHKNHGGKGKVSEEFELPLRGATGFASYPVTLFSQFAPTEVLSELSPGDAFTVLEEQGTNWLVTTEDGKTGLVAYDTCYLNIPDVIPSVILNNTNSDASVFVSSGEAIPDITGEKLYEATFYSERFREEKCVVAANYNMVKKIYAIQKAALAEGYSLVINETFRPLDVQKNISVALSALRQENETVRAGIDKAPWGIAWFIAFGISTHQMGCAMDVTLARVTTVTWDLCGEYRYPTVSAWQECEMPTAFHELSSAAAALKQPVSSASSTAWKTVEPADSMTEDALRLRQYCTDAGMSPLASEWWHFNDLDTKEMLQNRWVESVFYLDSCVSKIPD